MISRSSKKQVFGGGLYLKYILGILCITPCCFADLIGTELKSEDDLHHFTLSLEFKSNVAYKLSQEECADWIKADQYKDSIYKVISNAIADCVLKRNEFAKDKVEDDVIKFAGTEPKDYDEANWNAVVLYNLVYYIRGSRFDEGISQEDVLQNFFKKYIEEEKIAKGYGQEYKQKMEDAFNDIKEYDKNLNIIDFIINKGCNFYRTNSLNVKTMICENYNKNSLAKITLIRDRKKLYSK